MFKKILKWTGIVFGSLVVLVLLLTVAVYFITESRANKIYAVNIQQLAIPTDAASYALGEHIYSVRGCNDCHANGGKVFFDNANPIVFLTTSNLTNGKGGINYSEKDWLRALRHGVGKDGKALWFMPVQHTSAGLSNKDLGALICYLKTLPPVDTEHAKKSMKPLGRVLTFLGKFPMFPAEIVDHNAIYREDVKPMVNKEYGQYMAIGCTGCHGPNYKGGEGKEPGQPYIPDITNTGRLAKWTSDQFITVLHTGKTPDGRTLTPYMPWQTMGKAHNEDELKAIYMYLHSLN